MTRFGRPVRRGVSQPLRDADHQRVKGINWVVYDYTSKPAGTIEWE